jgi:hypothetical protein
MRHWPDVRQKWHFRFVGNIAEFLFGRLRQLRYIGIRQFIDHARQQLLRLEHAFTRFHASRQLRGHFRRGLCDRHGLRFRRVVG